jgi:hypothetical protein
MRLELGEISDEEFTRIESDVLSRIREMKGGQRGAFTMSRDDTIAGVEIESFKSEG